MVMKYFISLFSIPIPQVTTTSVVIRVEDVNDNYPQFEQNEYLRVVQELATEFQPTLIIQVGVDARLAS